MYTHVNGGERIGIKQSRVGREYITCKMEAGPSGHSFGQIYATEAMEVDEMKENLVGEPYAVVESDPRLFVLVAL